MEHIYIVILNWNRKLLTENCIKSVLYYYPDYLKKIVVIDNASTDGSIKYIKNEFPGIKIIRNRKNLGYSGGSNVGIRFALKNSADYVIILNNDIEIKANFAEGLLKPFKAEANVGIIGGKVLDPDKKTVQSAGYILKRDFWSKARSNGLDKDNPQLKKVRDVDFVSGAAFCVRRDVFEKIGLFDERFFMYFEEADLCVRAKEAGFKILYSPHSEVIHNQGSTSGLLSPLFTYYNYRNHLLFINKHGRQPVLYAEILKGFKLSLKKSIKLNPESIYIALGILDYLFRRFGYRKYWSLS